MTKSLPTHSVIKKIQRFTHEALPLLPDLSLHIQPTLDDSCQSAVTLSVIIQLVMRKHHIFTQSQKEKSQESKVCSVLLITQHTAESLLLQLLTTCHSRAGPRYFGVLGEIRIWGPQTAKASVNHHYMLSVGFCHKIFLGCLLSNLNKSCVYPSKAYCRPFFWLLSKICFFVFPKILYFTRKDQ